MRDYDGSEETVEIRRLKSLIRTDYYPGKDFSDQVMKRIEQLGRTSHRSRRASLLSVKGIAVAVCIVSLLSGFTYAANEWLNLRDKKGNAMMEIRQTELSVPAEQTRALAEVRAKLAPGESAVVYFGSKEEIRQKTTDQILWTQSPVKYGDWNSFLNSLSGPLADSRLAIQVPNGYEFQGAEVYLNDLPGEEGGKNSLVFARTPDGLEYAYSTRQPGSQIVSVAAVYRNNDREIRYQVYHSEKETKTAFFVNTPSKEAIVKVNGTETYYHNFGSEAGLLWAENGGSVTMNYSIVSSTATKQQLIEFAEKAIPAD